MSPSCHIALPQLDPEDRGTMNPLRHPFQGQLLQFSTPISFTEAWRLQQQFRVEHLSGTNPDVLMLLEHQPIYTMGRRTKMAHLGPGEFALRSMGCTVQAVNRGGSVTYHGPGQLVGYPILQLSRYASGPKQYVYMLEEVLIGTLELWGIDGYRVDKNPGVWVQSDQGEAKIASIGIRVDRGITQHGFSLNVELDLAPFSLITPCGLANCRTTSLAELCHRSVSLELVAEQVAKQFSDCFRISWSDRSAEVARTACVDPFVHSFGIQES